MVLKCPALALGFAIAALSCPSSASGQQIRSSQSISPAKLADQFRHPLGDGELTERRGDKDGWYVAEDFGDPLGEFCTAVNAPLCYYLGEAWKREGLTLGEPVHAIANGTVLDFGYAPRSEGKLPNSLGNYILIKHTLPAPGRRILRFGRIRTVVSLYAHLADLKGICGSDSLSCEIGQAVRIGNVIGHVGRTGAHAHKGPRLHFEIRLTDETCTKGLDATERARCRTYLRERYPLRFEDRGGWLDPTCFIKNIDAPQNDFFADAVSIQVGSTRHGSNLCATKEDGEPHHAGRKINKHGLNAGGKSVWWKFTAPENGRYSVSTVGSKFDTTLGIYVKHGTTDASGIERAQRFPANLHAVGQNDSENAELCDSASFCTSKVTFLAKAGVTYYIAVDGLSTHMSAAASGPIRLSVEKAGQQLHVTPASTSFQPTYEGGPFARQSVNYQVSSSEGTLAYAVSNIPPWLTPSSTFGQVGTSPEFVTFEINDRARSLKAGIHTATLVFGSSSSQRPQTRTISVRVKETPELAIAGPEINASGNRGGPYDPSSFPFQLSATSGKVKYSISGMPSWLTASSRTGMVSETPATVTFTLNSNVSALPAGTHNAAITFTNLTNGKGTKTITAVVTVKDLQVAPETGILASGPQGGPFDPGAFQYAIKTTSGLMTYAISGVPHWLTASSLAGTATTTPTNVNFAVNGTANGLPVGSHSATITFTNAANGNVVKALSAVLAVIAPPSLELDPASSIVASGPPGGPFSASTFDYAIRSTYGSVDYSISGVPSWLNVSQASGTVTTSPSTITFTLNNVANTLEPGVHSALITFANSTNGQGTTSRSATLSVVVPPTNYLTDGNGGYLLDSTGVRLAGL
jgi:hypothetical protein